MWLFIAFLAVPIIEIALFIQVGGWIGLWPTLAIVVITAILGTFLVRTQMILVAGALLLTPGFFTDAAGFTLLIPGARSAVFRYIKARIKVQNFAYGDPRRPQPRTPHGRGDVIDGDYEEVEQPKSPTHPPSNNPSGWTRH